jgi:hypothetical protein
VTRQQRRHVERELVKLIETDGDNCSICRTPFQHNSRTYGGISANGSVAVVADCCLGKINQLYTSGVYLARNYKLPRAKTASCLSAEDIEKNVALLQKAVAAIDKHEAETIAKKAGIPAIIPDWAQRPWKADDAKWFRENPSRSHRIRPAFPKEPHAEGAPKHHVSLMLVRQVEPGNRVKLAIAIYQELLPLPDSDALLRAMFDACTQSPPVKKWTMVSPEKIKELASQYAAADQQKHPLTVVTGTRWNAIHYYCLLPIFYSSLPPFISMNKKPVGFEQY